MNARPSQMIDEQQQHKTSVKLAWWIGAAVLLWYVLAMLTVLR